MLKKSKKSPWPRKRSNSKRKKGAIGLAVGTAIASVVATKSRKNK